MMSSATASTNPYKPTPSDKRVAVSVSRTNLPQLFLKNFISFCHLIHLHEHYGNDHESREDAPPATHLKQRI
jgi:hypothetical protein